MPVAPPSPSANVVFTGVMDYVPNIDAVTWMARQVWPLVRAARPDAQFQIVGARPTAAVRRLAGQGVVVTGTVSDTRPHLWNAAVGIAPLLMARGIQNKVLEAVAAGLPVVTTPVVADGLPGEVMPAVDVAAHPQAFADAVLARLADTPEDRRSRAQSADLAPLSWSLRFAAIPLIVSEAARAAR
jgi:glycosyltransferase involved in cell wall biosynthesis